MNGKNRLAWEHRFKGGALVVLISLAMMLLSANLQAQNAPAPLRLSPEQAVELAVKNNLGLESSRIGLETRRRASNLSWNQFLPTVDLGTALLRLNKAPEAVTMPLGSLNALFPPGMAPFQDIVMGGGSQWRMAGSVTLSINFNYAMLEEMKKLKLDFEKGLISFEKAKVQLERDVRKTYHNMLLLQENISLLRGSFQNVERQVQMAQANYNAGLTPELTLLQARVARENMRPVIDQVESGYKLSMAQLAMYLGLDYNAAIELIPIAGNNEFISFDVAQMISQAASGKPEIRELRQDILSLNSVRKSTFYRIYTPTVSLSWNADPTFNGDPWRDSWFDFSRWKQSQGMFRISVGMRLNGLIPIGTEKQGLRTIDDQIRMANIGLAQLIRGTEIEIYNIVLSLDRTNTNARALAQTVALAEQSYRLTEQAYRAGLQDYFQVQNAEQSLRQARVQLLEQQFTYLNGLIDLEYAIGVPFGTLSTRSER
ncbi:MAG: TolC family protein [Treponema sp.]|nr:TolC family protein [Treponema sp.]